jgi:eukaryotic-like serine/threonine-protein kinase
VRVVCRNCGQKNLLQRTFDHFVPVETLGAGGMGTVYKARDTQLERFVALKLLHKDLSGVADNDAQLQQEARVAASVNHPNVVQIFSLGMDHGQFYVVMELIDHGSLDDLIESQGRVPEHQMLDIGIQIARGLRAAHRKGLIHRDVKPANILFVDEQAAKIGDFGLAAFAAQDPQSDSVIWGTPPYVAPERLCNQPEDVRSDIYSLGATLFHAVAGKPPIDSSTNSATELRELKQHPAELRSIAPDVSTPTARVLQRMIAPDPKQRFSFYDELLAELDAARRALEFADARRQSSRWSFSGLFRHN